MMIKNIALTIGLIGVGLSFPMIATAQTITSMSNNQAADGVYNSVSNAISRAVDGTSFSMSTGQNSSINHQTSINANSGHAYRSQTPSQTSNNVYNSVAGATTRAINGSSYTGSTYVSRPHHSTVVSHQTNTGYTYRARPQHNTVVRHQTNSGFHYGAQPTRQTSNNVYNSVQGAASRAINGSTYVAWPQHNRVVTHQSNMGYAYGNQSPVQASNNVYGAVMGATTRAINGTTFVSNPNLAFRAQGNYMGQSRVNYNQNVPTSYACHSCFAPNW